VPEPLRGTYLGVASEASIAHLTSLGVTAVELMPVHHHLDEAHLREHGLVNYWGYNTLSYFAPDTRFAVSELPIDCVREFKTMVRALHAAGLEVILDVVYNHTAEGDHRGPTLSMRGIDNASYYRLQPHDRRLYQDFTGCGNTLNMRSPRVLQLMMDSLRYWVLEMHVDGFRFDLASALARELHAVDKLGAFFDTIHQDPVLSQVKLIAEPWDLGEGGYQVGNFPPRWAEWNGKYRDTLRAFWRGDGGGVAEMATRLSGSSDLYAERGRLPYASINFITSHDGFTMADLVAYERKHNEANGEGNRDGENHNLSWNNGIEGPTDDDAVNARRRQARRNLMASLLLSHGVPMLSGGDEIGRTQRGNNNAYCQDNEIGWTDWEGADHAFFDFVRRLIALRQSQPVLRRRRFFLGRSIRGAGVKDLAWFDTEGREMTDRDWSAPHVRRLGVLLAGDAIAEVDDRGRPVAGDSLLFLFNADTAPAIFSLPAALGDPWRLVLDTAVAEGAAADTAVEGTYSLAACATAVFRSKLRCHVP